LATSAPRWLLAGLPLFASALVIRCGEGDRRGASTVEERAKVVALSRSLEADPLREDAAASRRWIRRWMAEVPDLHFSVCGELLDDSLHGYAFAGEIKDQVAVSGAAFALEHQEKARDDVAVYTAGVDGALRTYQALLRSRPAARAESLDDLVARRNRGELGSHVAALAEQRCPRPRSAMVWIAALAGAGIVLLMAVVVAWLFRRRDSRGVLAANRAKALRTIVLVCAAYYVLVAAALHVLEPDYDPRYRFMSDYAWSSHGWLMTTTFFVLAAALLAVAFGMRDVSGGLSSARLGWGLLVVAALGVGLAGVFRGFPFHDMASALAIPGMAMAALFLSFRFRRAVEWRPLHRGTSLMSLGMVAMLLSMLANVGWPGLQQRCFLALILAWLCVVANRLFAIAAGLPAPRSQ
jgi:hypothetical membrane protein